MGSTEELITAPGSAGVPPADPLFSALSAALLRELRVQKLLTAEFAEDTPNTQSKARRRFNAAHRY